MSTNNYDRFLKQAEVAERLGVTGRTLEGWRWKNVGPRFYRLNGCVRYRTSDVEKWAEQFPNWTIG